MQVAKRNNGGRTSSHQKKKFLLATNSYSCCNVAIKPQKLLLLNFTSLANSFICSWFCVMQYRVFKLYSNIINIVFCIKYNTLLYIRQILDREVLGTTSAFLYFLICV